MPGRAGRGRRRVSWLAIMIFGLLASFPVRSRAVEIPSPGPSEVCPVCGMFVAKYPEWASTIVFADGEAEHFDGAKDLFKYLFDLARYAPNRDPTDIAAMAVTEYYGLTRIDPHAAWFVIGSDVLGPMGHELVPLASAEDADEFLADHQGKRVLRFDDVNPGLLEHLDAGAPAAR